MSIIDELKTGAVWRDFLDYRARCGRLPAPEAELTAFIEGEGFFALAKGVAEGAALSPPEKKLVNKQSTGRKRVVYTFPADESLYLKCMAYLLYRYDAAAPDVCCSFRRNYSAKRAIRRMVSLPNVDDMFCYKADVHDYFNSIDVSKLLPMLKELFVDDLPLYAFFERLLTADAAIYNGELICEKRGAMAGSPISPFLANVYLYGLDRHLMALGAPYARYSDDMIVFAHTREELDIYIALIRDTLAGLGLALNPDKQRIYLPGEAWEFLGIQYYKGTVDISRASRDKLMGKLRRKSRALLRWKDAKQANNERAMAAFARSVNRRLYDNPVASELTWAKWFFPLITTDATLKELDAYMRECMRYITSGRHTKANYRISHEALRDCGLKSLVNEYYRFKKQARALEEATEGTT